MEELTDYEFPYSVSLIGIDDFNDKFLILLLVQNGYKVKHFILDSKVDNIINLNEYYTKYELSAGKSKTLTKFIEDSNVVVINDLDNFERFSDLQSIKEMNKKNDGQFPLILNQKFEVFMPSLNCFYTIFDDKQMLSFSGILSSTRPYREFTNPFIPTVNIFEIFLKGIFIGTFINFSMYNKIQNNTTIEIINKPFLNLIYFHFTFFEYFIKNMTENLDKAESIFPRAHYNYVKTKDGKFVSLGNLESKFQKNMKKITEKLSLADFKEYNILEDDDAVPNNKKFSYDLDSLNKVFSTHNRDELFVKFYNTETCVTPVLSLEEALNFQKNLNKTISLNGRLKNEKKLESLKQIEQFFFKDLKNVIVVDLNPKVYINYNHNSNSENPEIKNENNSEQTIPIELSSIEKIMPPKF